MMVNPELWVTGVVPSAPRVTVHDCPVPVPPGQTVTSMVSEDAAGSEM